MNKIIKYKKNQGITLIALIVMIIVLLILSGITITMITENNSIINKSIEAKDDSETAIEKDALKKEIVYSVDKYGNLVADDLRDNINNNIADATATGDDFPISVEFQKTKHKYTIDEEGELDSDDCDLKVIFEANLGIFNNGAKSNVVKYSYKEQAKTQTVTKYLHTDNLNEKGEKVNQPSNISGVTVTKTATIPGAKKLKINIHYGIGNNNNNRIRAIKSVPQSEPALWEDNDSGEEEFEIDGDTVNIFFDGGIGGDGEYWGYYASVIGYDENNKVITEETGEKETVLKISEGTFENPTLTDGDFRGWYYDKNFKQKVTFNENNVIDKTNSKSVTVYAKWATETVFRNLNSYLFNPEARQLTATARDLERYGNYAPINAKYFEKSEIPPDESQDKKEIQTEDSRFPIYLWYDSSTSTLLWYCQEKPIMRGETHSLLYLWKSIRRIDFTGIDMSELDEFVASTSYSTNPASSIEIIFDESFKGTRRNLN